MTINPLVTVLMTVYNGGKYLRLSVESVLKQSFKDFEFLIVNDCSTDNSIEIIKSFGDERISIHSNEKNLGQTKSLNVGLNLAKGKYIARMDADDMAFPSWIEKLVDYTESHPEYAAVSAGVVVMNESGKFKKVFQPPTAFDEVIFHIFFGNAMNHVGSLINKEILLKNGGYNEEFKIAQDYELWSSLIRNNYRLINIDKILVAVRIHESSLGYTAERDKGLKEVAETIYRNINVLTTLKVTIEDTIKLRMFYRFPEELTTEEFKYAHELYERLFYSLKNGFKIGQDLLRRKMKRQMLIPFCKRAASTAEYNNPSDVREIVSDYLGKYGFHFMPFTILMMSLFSVSAVGRSVDIFSKFRESAVKIRMSRVKL